MIRGELSLPGEPGALPVTPGAAGAKESSTYVTELVEHADVLMLSSVAVAWNVVVLSSATVTLRPGEASSAGVP